MYKMKEREKEKEKKKKKEKKKEKKRQKGEETEIPEEYKIGIQQCECSTNSQHTTDLSALTADLDSNKLSNIALQGRLNGIKLCGEGLGFTLTSDHSTSFTPF